MRKDVIRGKICYVDHGPPGSSRSEKGGDKEQCLNISSSDAHNNCMAGVGGRVGADCRHWGLNTLPSITQPEVAE